MRIQPLRLLAIIVSSLLFAPAFAAAAEQKLNVLFFAIDDQNDWIGYMKGHPQAKTPNIDALAAKGTAFTNAHCQSPLCNPSRSSLLTGLRPSTTGIYGLAPGIRAVERTKDIVTLPQHLRQNGYWTFTTGKIFHDGSMTPKDREAEFEVWAPNPKSPRPKEKFVKEGAGPHPAMDWGVWPAKDEDHEDYKIADAAVKALADAPKDKPFMVACGLRLPHVPCYAPQKWFDLYPEDTLQMPPVLEGDRDDTPPFSWYLHWKLPEPRLSALIKANQWKPLVRAYLASTTFMDAQIGRVVEALEKTGRADNTVIVLWSDHGWHLGEKAITGKNTLWDRSTKVPLIFAGPGVKPAQVCNRPAELLDIYPTLIELLSLPPREGLEGHSLLPQLKDASAGRQWPAITTHNQGNHGIRTERWRYIRYADGSEELYDMQADPKEWTNLASKPEMQSVLGDMRQWLPKVDVPAAPGSKNRVLIKGINGEWVWEDEVIHPDALEK